MPTQQSLEEIETAELILAVDDGRAAGDPYKLTAPMRALVVARLADLRTKDSATFVTEGGLAAASLRVRDALDTLGGQLREGYNFINGLLSVVITKADKLDLFIKYGWLQGEIGTFDDARIESLANQALTVTPTITNAAYRYPQALLDLITAQLTIVNANQPTATGGTAQTATKDREDARKLLETVNDRVRFFYSSASDDEDQTTELAKIGKQPRRDRGEAGTQPLPGAAGHGDLGRSSAHAVRASDAGARHHTARVSQGGGRAARTGRHVHGHHSVGGRPGAVDAGCHLRAMGGGAQFPR